MQFTSKLAQAWIDYCLTNIKHTNTRVILDWINVTAHQDIEMMFDEQLIDADEREWALTAVQEALDERCLYLTDLLKRPPAHAD